MDNMKRSQIDERAEYVECVDHFKKPYVPYILGLIMNRVDLLMNPSNNAYHSNDMDDLFYSTTFIANSVPKCVYRLNVINHIRCA